MQESPDFNQILGMANDKVNLDIEKGEILSLLGENGAGKTTLMNILYGMYQADSGSILINQKKVDIHSPLVATELGISMVHQHFMLVNSLSVAENVVLGHEPRKGVFFDRARAFEEVGRLSEEYGLKVPPHEVVANLPVGMKQRVEILKTLYRKSEILILDEPTAVLTPREWEELYKVLEGFKKKGKSIILITHKLKETMQAADRIAILRQGRIVETISAQGASVDKLAEMMVGRRIVFSIDRKKMEAPLPTLLSLRNITVEKGGVKKLKGINLDLRGGEILGIAGVDGNGQTELIEVLSGLKRASAGEVLVEGVPVHGPTPQKMIHLRIGHIPEDRSTCGIISKYSIGDNLILGYHKSTRFCGKVQLKKREISKFAKETIEKFAIRCSGAEDRVENLSGGNQQKVVIGRVVSEDPQIVIAAQPTRGVDIGAIEYIHERLMELRDNGKAIILLSADLDEIIKLSDRISVLYDGQLVSDDTTSNYDESRLGALMTGQRNELAQEAAQ